MLARELLELAGCGADLCDVMGDYFDRRPDEAAVDRAAIHRQLRLIEALHERGAKVLMSSHIHKFTPAQRVLEIALEQQNRHRSPDDGRAVGKPENHPDAEERAADPVPLSLRRPVRHFKADRRRAWLLYVSLRTRARRVCNARPAAFAGCENNESTIGEAGV